MSACHKCGKPVYFAERRTSLGKHWHRECLQCEECGKVLHPGQHAEHKGIPYCNIPCYKALFGPKLYGHGSPIESHSQFGRGMMNIKKDSPVRRVDLSAKVDAYNRYQENKNGELMKKMVNGRLVLEGALRIYWGVTCQIQLKPKDDSAPPTPKAWRRSYHLAINNGINDDLLQTMDNGTEGLKGAGPKLDRIVDIDIDSDIHADPREAPAGLPNNTNGVHLREKKSGIRRDRAKRRSIINGHSFDLDTSVFTLAYGSVSIVRVSSLDPTTEVIKQLLNKYKVMNDPEDFCLCAVKLNWETTVLGEDDYPLIQRVLMGPLEDEAKLLIIEKENIVSISAEVAQYMSLPPKVLQGFLKKLSEDERQEIQAISLKFERYRKALLQQVDKLSSL